MAKKMTTKSVQSEDVKVPDSGMVWIVGTGKLLEKGLKKHVSAKLAKTLINKGAAKLK